MATTGVVATSLGPVAYRQEGDGRPILLLHANPGDRRDFDAVVPALAREHRVIAVDWPGYGDSPPPRPPSSATAVGYAALVPQIADELELRGLVVIGNSLGGFAAVTLALSRRDRVAALVLVNPGGFSRLGPARRAFCRIKGTERVTQAIALGFARRYLRHRNDHVRAILERTDAGRRNPARVAVDAAIWRSFLDADYDLRDVARGVQIPTLLVWGRHDPVLPFERDAETARAAISGARLVPLDTGHMPFAEDPASFLDEVLPFVGGLA